MVKEDLKELKRDLEQRCISLTKFLINYCGIYTENIHDMKISHQDIKELLPQLKRVSFESLLENKKSYYTGSIIPVKDCHGNVVPYVNPMLEYDVVVEFDCETTEEKNINYDNLEENMNLYELAKLCKYFKTHNKMKEYRSVHKKIEEKEEPEVKQYKKRKSNLIMEGRGLYD